MTGVSLFMKNYKTMNTKNWLLFSILGFLCLAVAVFFGSCSSNPNTNFDPHFDEEGCLVNNDAKGAFKPVPPKKMKFFIEVSGSMNGFFRANAPTKFKEDVWRILSYYAPIADNVTILSNEGAPGDSVPISSFQTKMNTGAFVSSASTKVPVMLQSIINSFHPENGEVAILISDMKYSPVGSAAPSVLLTQYSTDVSNIFGKFGKAISLIGAKSQYLDKSGTPICKDSPYYFLVLGNQEYVADLRNGISTLLENNDDFIGNIDSGFNYGAPAYSFGIADNCFQKDEEPTFTGYDTSFSDTCTVKLRVDLANYRWAAANKNFFPKAFKCKSIYGSKVMVGKIDYKIQNITDKDLVRTAYAEIELKVCSMPLESDVIEWTLELPDMDTTEFAPYFGATEENDVSKSYSLEDFIKGMFYGGVVNKTLKPNYILISKNS